MLGASIVPYLRAEPRRAFVFDGVGALVSTIALGLVLPSFCVEVGAARPALYLLAALPAAFMLYDLACVLLRPARWRAALRGIAAANASYVPVSIAVLLSDGVGLTALGVAYFAVELAIVGALAVLQVWTAGSPGDEPRSSP